MECRIPADTDCKMSIRSPSCNCLLDMERVCLFLAHSSCQVDKDVYTHQMRPHPLPNCTLPPDTVNKRQILGISLLYSLPSVEGLFVLLVRRLDVLLVCEKVGWLVVQKVIVTAEKLVVYWVACWVVLWVV